MCAIWAGEETGPGIVLGVSRQNCKGFRLCEHSLSIYICLRIYRVAGALTQCLMHARPVLYYQAQILAGFFAFSPSSLAVFVFLIC
jgi:hypothetical protein